MVSKFKVGDRVRVLSWEEMVSRTTSDCVSRDYIIFTYSTLSFIKNMREACGTVFTIAQIAESDQSDFVGEQILMRLPSGPGRGCAITNYMCELVQTKYPSNYQKVTRAKV